MGGTESKTIERTHTFPRDVPIDCRGWLEFTIVESTYRSWRIRYTQKVDGSRQTAVKSGERPATQPAPKTQ